MFSFALKMCVADMKRILHRFWWVAALLLILIVVAPFGAGQMYAFTYVVVMTLYWFIPRFSRIYFVIPLDEKQLKKFFVWRVVIVCAMMLLIAAIVIGVSEWQNLTWEPIGFHWLMSYLAMFMVSSETGIEGLGINKNMRIGVRQLIAIIIGVLCLFMGVIAMDYMPLKWILALSLGMMVFAVVDMIIYVRRIKMEDYTYVPLSLGESGKAERN